MGKYQGIILVLFSLIIASIGATNDALIKGSVTCLDCHGHVDLSGVKVSVKCTKVKNLAMATTSKDGSFETKLRNDNTNTHPKPSLKCFARILGGPTLLYTNVKNIGSKIVKIKGQDYYTNSEPLNFYKSCPADKYEKCSQNADNQLGSSKTVDFPLPSEWGLAPTSYYFPFIPIIGIP